MGDKSSEGGGGRLDGWPPSPSEGGRRGYWRWSKEDFFPGPSFASWAAYAAAVAETGPRLRSRLLRRSTSAAELRLLPKRSEHGLRKCLTWWDLAWLGFGAVVGSGVFVLTGLEARYDSGPAIVLAYAAAGFTALLSVFCYAEFALGDFVAYIAAANILLEALVGAAGVARSWTSYFATLIDRHPDSLRIRVPALADGFNLLDPIAVAVLVACSAFAASGTRRASCFNWVTSLVSIAVIGFIVVGGSGVFRAAGVVYWAYTGFDMVATMAEETRNPARDIPLGLVGSMAAITAVYCVMALVLCMMQSYEALDPDAAFSVAFAAVGMRWAKYLVSLGALKGMTTGLLVGALGQSRYTTQIARTGTPVNATVLITGAAACIALFSSLDVLATVSSISTLFIFMLTAVSLLIRRYYVRGVTKRSGRLKLLSLLVLIVGSSAGMAACWVSDYRAWAGYAGGGAVWLLATLGLALAVPQQRAPRVWGAPLVPWLPSLSIAANLFLMASLGSDAFMRFGVCTAVMLAYYLIVGLHATYDVDQQQQASEASPADKGGNASGGGEGP
ncbi:unnamed protein product [Spirodela intermedia]|uniref:Cationic amino acid transporter C-terminal domain-containing protein n=1 Tax=Spirodela intermedia TaxID=51605 RepID=A0A7I8IW43_SPIIN|nr:unnamed protein product [Spirodela intermedia]CAA6661370.1 unnamed protein product [Spirodela intermedia]